MYELSTTFAELPQYSHLKYVARRSLYTSRSNFNKVRNLNNKSSVEYRISLDDSIIDTTSDQGGRTPRVLRCQKHKICAFHSERPPIYRKRKR